MTAATVISAPSLGTKDIFLENSVSYFFGKYNALSYSSRNKIIDTTLTNEFFGKIAIAHKWVGHNTILQGGITANETTFTASPIRNIFTLSLGGTLKVKKSTFGLDIVFNTKETAASTGHNYGVMSYTFLF